LTRIQKEKEELANKTTPETSEDETEKTTPETSEENAKNATKPTKPKKAKTEPIPKFKNVDVRFYTRFE
jgi:hypothetical protein